MRIADRYPEMLKEVEIDPNERWMSPLLNRVSGATSPGLTQSITVHDDTIRSGGNTPGVSASVAEKMELALKLEEVGVTEAEVGYPSIPEQVEFVKTLKRNGSKLQCGMHTRYYDPDYRREIQRAVDSQADIVNMVGYWGYIVSKALCPQLWEANIEERVGDAVSYAKSLGAKKVSIGTDYHRLDLIARFVTAAAAGGADRIMIYDGRGWFAPQTVAFLVRYVRVLAGPSVEIGVHCHNDMGLATINTIEGLRAGATVCDLTVNSTGHRCGNAAFEEVVPTLEVLYGIRTGIDLTKLIDLSQTVQRLYHIPVADNRSMVGKQMFSYGGSHIAGILRGEWYFWENIRAESIGHKRYITFGPPSLRRGETGPVAVKVQQMGYTADEKKLDKVFEAMELQIKKRKEMTEPEVEEIIRKMYA